MGSYRLRPPNRLRKGSVLLFCLWATAALATTGIAQARRVALQVRWLDRQQEERQAWFLAYSAIQGAQAILAADDSERDGLQEAWGQEVKQPYPLGPGTFVYTIQDEQSRLPINVLTQDLLTRLPGMTLPLAQKVIEERLLGHRILHPAQLRFFGLMSSEDLQELGELVTCASSGPVNLNTAPKEVLLRLGLSPVLIDQLLLYRSGPDATAGTGDDRFFERSDSAYLVTVLHDAIGYSITPEDQATLSTLSSGGAALLGVKSNFFRIEGLGMTQAHGIQKKIMAVVDREGHRWGWNES